jgi:hypothetical protein
LAKNHYGVAWSGGLCAPFYGGSGSEPIKNAKMLLFSSIFALKNQKGDL